MSANVELKRVKEWAWMRGFANLYQKESQAWWSTKRCDQRFAWLAAAGMLVAMRLSFPPLCCPVKRQADNEGW
jgi:hypothetical protein